MWVRLLVHDAIQLQVGEKLNDITGKGVNLITNKSRWQPSDLVTCPAVFFEKVHIIINPADQIHDEHLRSVA